MSVDMNREFTFQFTYAQADYIIKTLGKQPFEEVSDIIRVMQQQYESQAMLPQEPIVNNGESDANVVQTEMSDAADIVKIGAHDRTVPDNQDEEKPQPLRPAQPPQDDSD